MNDIYTAGEISDRLAIYDMYARYVHHCDAFDHAALDSIFNPDTTFDWSASGYRNMTWAEAKNDPLMAGKLFSHAFHINTNFLITFGEGRRSAEVLSKTVNPMGVTRVDGKVDSFQVHGGYADRLVRLPAGWKIAHRQWRNAFISAGSGVLTQMSDMLSPARANR